MDLFQAVVLAVIEGITEFLPISSTGHLILASSLFNIQSLEFVKSYEIIIQLGAVLSILIIYIQRLLKNIHLIKVVFVGFLPAVVFGLVFYPLIKSYLLENTAIVLISLFIGGIVLMFVERYAPKPEIKSLEEISYKKSLIIGLGQTLALIPGVSRSGSSIVTAMFVKLDKRTSVEFSFLLAVPTILAASAYDLLKSYDVIFAGQVDLLIIGFIISFITAYISVRWFLNYVTNHSLRVFGIYRIVLSVILAFVFYM